MQSLRPFGGSAASILQQIGLSDWIAHSQQTLLTVAIQKMGVVEIAQRELVQLRATLRERMNNSVLRDGAGFTRELESAFRSAHHAQRNKQGQIST